MLVVKIILLPIEVLAVINSHNQPKSTAEPENKKKQKNVTMSLIPQFRLTLVLINLTTYTQLQLRGVY
jgi:hypothetical protein